MNGKTNHGIFKKLLLVFVMTVLCALFAVSASAETVSGECGKQGDNVTWTFDTETGTLTIAGEGEMADYATIYDYGEFSGTSVTESPWIKQSCNVKKAIICDGVTSVGAGAFYGSFYNTDTFLTEVVLPQTLKSIGALSFMNCNKLVKVTGLSTNVEFIGQEAFSGCSSLEKFDVPSKIKTIEKRVFEDCSRLSEIILPLGVESIGNSAFEGCSSLEKIVIPESVKSIGTFAFLACSSIAKIVLPSEIRILENGVFEECYKLIEIEIPESVETIGGSAFWLCKSLKSINIPANVKEISNDSFLFCSSLERITVDPDNQYYSSDDNGVLFNKDKTTLIKYPDGNKMTEYNMPDTVRIIDEEAFHACAYIKNVRLSDNLESLKSFAFAECYSLQHLSFPNSLKRVEIAAIMYCWSLKNIVLPENIEYLGIQAIVGCPALESVTVNGMNTQIDEMALCGVDFIVDGISIEEFADMAVKAILCIDDEEKDAIWEELSQYQVFFDEISYIGTIRCHAGSTAEAYAKENGVDYELVHFFGDWVYDWDNLVRSRKCSVCDYTETEPLEKNENGGVEIVEPVDPDTEFIVEEITKNGDKYAVVEKSLSENLEGNYTVLKTFDITLKNKDGVHVQPDGIVKVKLPLDWDKDGDYKVYRVNDDGTLTDMEAYREGSHMVFDTDHFSVYVIVDESPVEPEEPEENNSPFGFFAEVIRMFKELLYKIITFFQSIGDMT